MKIASIIERCPKCNFDRKLRGVRKALFNSFLCIVGCKNMEDYDRVITYCLNKFCLAFIAPLAVKKKLTMCIERNRASRLRLMSDSEARYTTLIDIQLCQNTFEPSSKNRPHENSRIENLFESTVGTNALL